MKISVIITAYNAEKYIERCVNSVLNQTYKNLEVIVVNDASTDRTLEILQSFDDERLKIITMKENSGCGLCRRKGISLATGDYMGMVDSDDWIDNNFYETLLSIAKEHKADIVASGLYINDEDDSIIETMVNPRLETFSGRYKYYNEKLYWRYPNNSIYSRNVFEKVDYYPEPLRSDMPYRFATRYFANMLVMSPYVGYHYVQQPDSLCHTYSSFKCDVYDCLADIHQLEFIKDHPDIVIEPIHKRRINERLQNKSKKVINSKDKQFAKDLIKEIEEIEDFVKTHNV